MKNKSHKIQEILIPKIIILTVVLTLCNRLFGQDTAVYFVGQTTTWTAPPCVTEVTVECWGGGGAGGNGVNSFVAVGAGGGGAGGSYARKKLTVTPGTTYSLSAAGSQTTPGSAGADSWFMNTTTVLAKGGAGGSNSSSGGNGNGGVGSASGSVGDAGFVFAGGNGENGNNTGAGGAGGGAANAGGAGGNGSGGVGGAPGAIGPGLPIGGMGANGVSNANGEAGSNYAGGGSGGNSSAGAAATKNGGAGGPGLVIIAYGTNPTKVNSTAICSGQSATLTASGVTGYNWLPNGETTSSITVSPTTTTTYTIVGSNGSCTGSAVATVTVYAPVKSNSVTICPGNDVILLAEGSQSFQWSTGATTSSISLTNVTTSAAYTVTGTSCGVTSTAVSSILVDNCVSVTFSNAGASTWTAPACVTSVIAEVWGGGGGGGGGTNNDKSGAGGGGGGYSKSGPITVVGGTVYNVMVGAGGTAGNAAKGGDGGDSWFLNNTTILARGGKGGGSGGNAVSGLGGALGLGGATMYKGGDGGKDYSQTTNGSGGGGGGSAGSGGHGKPGTNAANGVTNAKGGVAVSGGGAGGDGCGQGGSLLPDCAGSAGTEPGGGGGGGNDDDSGGRGGAGAKGKVVISYKVTPLTISVNDGYICTGSSATLTANGATTYTWTPATGLSATTGASVTANPPSSTTYTVTGTTAGCNATAVSVVTFTACCTQATIGLSSATGTDAQAICTNAAIVPITYAVGGGGTNATVAGLPSGLSDAFASGTLTISGTPTQTGTFNYTVTTSGGCGPEEALGSITINDLPVITSTNSSVCAGQSATLSTGGAGIGGTYLWQPGGSTDVSFLTPAISAPTSFTVTGTDINGCSNTSVSTVSLLSSLNITVSGNNSVCSGTSTALTAAGAVNYTWSPSTFLSSTTGTTTTVTPTTPTTYTVTGDDNGCTGSATVTVNINPSLNITITGNNSVCSGTNTTLTAVGGVNYTWSPSTFLSSTTGASTTATPTSQTTYTVVGEDNGCTGTATITVSIAPSDDASFSYSGVTFCNVTGTYTPTAPVAGLYSISPAGTLNLNSTTGAIDIDASTTLGAYNISHATNGTCPSTYSLTITVVGIPNATFNYSGPYCQGGSVNATITQPSGATPGTFTVSPSGLTFVNANTGEINLSASLANTYTVTNTIAAGGGCPSATDDDVVTINSGPNTTVTSTVTCLGNSAIITAGGATSYTWLGGGTPSGTNNQDLTDSPTTNKTYTVTGTTSGCTSTATGTITVTPNPVVGVIPPAPVCPGNPGTLTATGATTYVWTGGGTPSGAGSQNLLDSPLASKTYTVTGAIGTCSATATGTITVAAAPVITTSNASICAGQTANLSASGATTYSWLPNIGNSPSVTTPVLTTNTSYTVTGSNPTGCSNKAVVSVVVAPSPTVNVTSVSICAGGSATLTANGATNYAWLPGGTTGNTITVTSTASANYTVTGTSGNCTSTGVGSVYIYPSPVAAFKDLESFDLSEANVSFVDMSVNAASWLWDFGDASTSTEQNPLHTYTDTGTYIIWLKVASAGGCVDSTYRDVRINPEILMFIPNAFTPDEDGKNDEFSFKSSGITSDGFEFRIFDRWGLQVFYTTDINEAWKGDFNGVACPQDIYVYSIIFKDGRKKEKKFIGNISLLR